MTDVNDIVDVKELGRSYKQVIEQTHEGDAKAAEPTGIEQPTAPPSVLRIVEALLFVGGTALTAQRAKEIIRGLTNEQFDETVTQLNQHYRQQGRPYTVAAKGNGFALTLRPRYRGVPEKLYGTVREARLSTAAVDVLSLIAYRQPTTKQELDSLRGAESGALVRQLVRRGLVTVVRRADAEQREVAYGTTPRFLELFGLSSMEDLPRTQDF